MSTKINEISQDDLILPSLTDDNQNNQNNVVQPELSPSPSMSIDPMDISTKQLSMENSNSGINKNSDANSRNITNNTDGIKFNNMDNDYNFEDDESIITPNLNKTIHPDFSISPQRKTNEEFDADSTPINCPKSLLTLPLLPVPAVVSPSEYGPPLASSLNTTNLIKIHYKNKNPHSANAHSNLQTKSITVECDVELNSELNVTYISGNDEKKVQSKFTNSLCEYMNAHNHNIKEIKSVRFSETTTTKKAERLSYQQKLKAHKSKFGTSHSVVSNINKYMNDPNKRPRYDNQKSIRNKLLINKKAFSRQREHLVLKTIRNAETVLELGTYEVTPAPHVFLLTQKTVGLQRYNNKYKDSIFKYLFNEGIHFNNKPIVSGMTLSCGGLGSKLLSKKMWEISNNIQELQNDTWTVKPFIKQHLGSFNRTKTGFSFSPDDYTKGVYPSLVSYGFKPSQPINNAATFKMNLFIL